MTFIAPSARIQSLLFWAFVVTACVLRFIHLDSDPKFEYWIFYVEDEGRWVETARNLALFGELRLYSISKLHFVLSPLFQAVDYVVFKLAGVSIWSARIWPAACGAAIVVVFALLLRRITSGLPIFLGLGILALEPLTLAVSRTALPEIPSLFFTFLAFIVICTWRRPILSAICGGLLLVIAIGMKATTVLMMPAFLLIVALSVIPHPARRQQLLRCCAFLAALLIPALILLAVGLIAGYLDAGALTDVWPALQRSLRLGGLYTLASRFMISDTEYANVNLLLLGAWLCSWVLPFRNEYRGTLLGKVYELSGVWAAGWLVAWAFISYTPARYSVQVILPLVIHVTAGLGLWRNIGVARVLTNINPPQARGGIAFFVWLVLPIAVLASILLIDLAGLAGVPNDRLVYKLIVIGAIVVALVRHIRTRKLDESVVPGLLAATVLIAVAGMTIAEVGAIVLSRSDAGQVLPIVNLVVFAGVAWYCLARSTSIARLPSRTLVGALACSLALAGLLMQSALELIEPTYTIRTASQTTARLFPDATLLLSAGAGTLLLETTLPYRDRVARGTTVDGLINFDRRFRIGPEFVLVDTYRLAVHPRYRTKSPPLMDAGAALVEVYRNVQVPLHSAAPSP